jgi:hypothetical protein
VKQAPLNRVEPAALYFPPTFALLSQDISRKI